MLSVGAILLIVVADPAYVAIGATARWIDVETVTWLQTVGRAAIVMGFNLVLAHLLVTTCHGLYYLIDRLYAKKPVLLSKTTGHPKVRTPE